MDRGIKKKVTIGLCVKNSEQTIKEAVESIISQTYPHELMELIIVDGGSKDKTLSIITDTISKTDVHYKIFFDEGRGLGVARQMVVDNACGEYLIVVDADAIAPKDYVRDLVEFMEQNPRLGGAKGIQEIMNPTSLTDKLENLSLSLRRTPRHIFDGQGIFLIEAIRQIGGYDTRIKEFAEDVDLITRIMRAGWLFSVSDAKFYHTIGSWKRIWERGLRDGFRVRSHDFNIYFSRVQISHVHARIAQTFPFVFIIGIRDSFAAYKSTLQKISFFLPFYYFFKSIPWWLGFTKSHIDSYIHTYSNRK